MLSAIVCHYCGGDLRVSKFIDKRHKVYCLCGVHGPYGVNHDEAIEKYIASTL